jgi:hypothetical protein
VKRTLWVKSGVSDLLIPATLGAKSAVASSTELSFLEGKRRANSVADIYRELGVPIRPNCDLAKHIAAAVKVSDQWMSARVLAIQVGLLVRGIQMDTIASSVLAAKTSPNIAMHLRHLASGSLGVFMRNPSKAKNTLWELKLHAMLRGKSITADLEEPDIVANVDGMTIGIACKKIYSHSNVEKTLSIGVAQIERLSDYGVLAINIDDLWPPNQLRVATSVEYLGQTLSQENLQFLIRHDRHFRKYLSVIGFPL